MNRLSFALTMIILLSSFIICNLPRNNRTASTINRANSPLIVALNSNPGVNPTSRPDSLNVNNNQNRRYKTQELLDNETSDNLRANRYNNITQERQTTINNKSASQISNKNADSFSVDVLASNRPLSPNSRERTQNNRIIPFENSKSDAYYNDYNEIAPVDKDLRPISEIPFRDSTPSPPSDHSSKNNVDNNSELKNVNKIADMNVDTSHFNNSHSLDKNESQNSKATDVSGKNNIDNMSITQLFELLTQIQNTLNMLAEKSTKNSSSGSSDRINSDQRDKQQKTPENQFVPKGSDELKDLNTNYHNVLSNNNTPSNQRSFALNQANVNKMNPNSNNNLNNYRPLNVPINDSSRGDININTRASDMGNRRFENERQPTNNFNQSAWQDRNYNAINNHNASNYQLISPNQQNDWNSSSSNQNQNINNRNISNIDNNVAILQDRHQIQGNRSNRAFSNQRNDNNLTQDNRISDIPRNSRHTIANNNRSHNLRINQNLEDSPWPSSPSVPMPNNVNRDSMNQMSADFESNRTNNTNNSIDDFEMTLPSLDEYLLSNSEMYSQFSNDVSNAQQIQNNQFSLANNNDNSSNYHFNINNQSRESRSTPQYTGSWDTRSNAQNSFGQSNVHLNNRNRWNDVNQVANNNRNWNDSFRQRNTNSFQLPVQDTWEIDRSPNQPIKNSRMDSEDARLIAEFNSRFF